MHKTLTQLTQKPALFEGFDTSALWTDPHVAKQMLALHLDDESPLASRPFGEIDAMVEWLSRAIEMRGKVLLDLGCGPGLYAARFAQAGAEVIGLDISKSSIAYATSHVSGNARFLVGSYHEVPLPQCDIAVLIYGDICAMPRTSRIALFKRIRASMAQGGHLVVDCFAPSFLETCKEELLLQPNLDGGFWAPPPYFGFKQSFLYRDETAVLDRYLIVEPDRMRWVNNWIQCLSPDQLTDELAQAGFTASEPKDIAKGTGWTREDHMFCCLAEAN